MLSQCTLKIPIGNTDSQVRFNIYDRVKQAVKPPTATKTDNMSSTTNGKATTLPLDTGEGMSSSKETEKTPAVVAVEETPAHGDQSQMTAPTATLEIQPLLHPN